MTDDSTIPAKPLECRPGPDSPDQADNLWRPRRRLALRTARPPRLLIRFRNPCRRDRRRTFGWYVRFTSAPPCAGSTHSCRCARNEWLPRAGSSGRVPRGPSKPLVRTGDRTQLDRLTLRGHDGGHNRGPGELRNGPATDLAGNPALPAGNPGNRQKSCDSSEESTSTLNTRRTVRLDCPPRRTPQVRQAADQRDHLPSTDPGAGKAVPIRTEPQP